MHLEVGQDLGFVRVFCLVCQNASKGAQKELTCLKFVSYSALKDALTKAKIDAFGV